MVLGIVQARRASCAQVPPTWWPRDATLDNYTQLFTKLDFRTYFINSVVVAVAVTAGNLLFCSMLGYALAKLDFPGKQALFVRRARHADDPRRRDLRAAVRARSRNIGLANTLPGHDPAVPGRPVRGVPDAAVHPRACPTS